jgi:hypothetical protein
LDEAEEEEELEEEGFAGPTEGQRQFEITAPISTNNQICGSVDEKEMGVFFSVTTGQCSDTKNSLRRHILKRANRRECLLKVQVQCGAFTIKFNQKEYPPRNCNQQIYIKLL